MAKYERFLRSDPDSLLTSITQGVLAGSLTATLKDRSDFVLGDARCSVLVFERYSMASSDRLSLNVTVFAIGTDVHLSAITSGGGQSAFMASTLGEQTFLDSFRKVLASIPTD